MYPAYICGVDIGGSHITAAIIDTSRKSVIHDTYARSRINAAGTIPEIIDAWSAVIRPLLAHRLYPADRIGIAMPGPFDYEQGIALMKGQGKYDHLYGCDVRQLLAAALHTETTAIRFKNDAAAFLSGEVLSGAAKGFDQVLGLTLGTGLGTTWHTQGATIDADLWNTPFEDSIAEEYISSRWFVRRYHELTGKKVKDVQELSLLVPTDVVAANIFKEFGTRLGVFLAHIVQHIYPARIIVLGGNIAHAMPLFMDAVQVVFAEKGIHIPVKKAMLGEEAALIGAVL